MNFGEHVIFRQLFDQESYTYTYLIADAQTREAVLIDPVIEQTAQYQKLLKELNLKLVIAMDTHTHADHITALGRLRDELGCTTRIGQESQSECVSKTFSDGDNIQVGRLSFVALHTPGHTDDSYSFALKVNGQNALFTGDTLLIRGTGRTDFQQGDALSQYDSLFNILLKYPENTWVYPGHDYRGWTVSTVGEERHNNPRLQIRNAEEYADIMNTLNLPNPKLMDLAIPANQACGKE